jgi:hypothetical protein
MLWLFTVCCLLFTVSHTAKNDSLGSLLFRGFNLNLDAARRG